MRFSRQEYQSGLPFPSPGDLPNPGIEPLSLESPTLAKQVLYHYTTLQLCLAVLQHFDGLSSARVFLASSPDLWMHECIPCTSLTTPLLKYLSDGTTQKGWSGGVTRRQIKPWHLSTQCWDPVGVLWSDQRPQTAPSLLSHCLDHSKSLESTSFSKESLGSGSMVNPALG